MIKTILFSFFAAFTINIGHAQSDQQKIDSLKNLLQKENTDTGKIRKLIRIGHVYFDARNDSTLLYYKEALSLSQKSGSITDQFQSRYQMARFFSAKADYASALDLFLQNISESEKTGNTTNIFLDTRDIGYIYELIEDFDRGIAYTNKLRTLLNSGMFKDSSKLSDLWVSFYNRIGSLYEKINNQDSGKFYKLKVYQKGLENNDQNWIAFGSNGLGIIYTNLNNLDSAIYYYRAAMPASLAVKRFDTYSNSLMGLGKIYWLNKQVDSAFYFAKKAFAVSQQRNSFLNRMEAATLLSEIYYAKNNPDSAYIYLRKSMLLKDSVFSSEKKSRLQNLSFKESMRKQQQEQDKKEALASYKSKIQSYGFIAGFAVMLIVIFILFRNNRQRNLANQKIKKAFHELKSTQSQLIQSEKMASLGELTAGIAHEIQNPLNFVNNFSEVNKEMLEELKAERLKPNAERDDDLQNDLINDVIANSEKINHHGKRADAIVKGMLQHSRSSTGTNEPTDINALADEYLRLAYHGLRAKDKSFNATLITDFDERIGKVNMVSQDISRVILNLINNAFYAVNEKAISSKAAGVYYEPTVIVSTQLISSTTNPQIRQSANSIIISVKDNGNGIPQKILDKIFQPFFTTKPTGQGTGLGLSLSYDIVKAHGGEIKVETPNEGGTNFHILLPLNQ